MALCEPVISKYSSILLIYTIAYRVAYATLLLSKQQSKGRCCNAKWGRHLSREFQNFTGETKLFWSDSIRIMAIEFRYAIEYDERFFSFWSHLLYSLIYGVQKQQNDEIKEHDSYPFW